MAVPALISLLISTAATSAAFPDQPTFDFSRSLPSLGSAEDYERNALLDIVGKFPRSSFALASLASEPDGGLAGLNSARQLLSTVLEGDLSDILSEDLLASLAEDGNGTSPNGTLPQISQGCRSAVGSILGTLEKATETLGHFALCAKTAGLKNCTSLLAALGRDAWLLQALDAMGKIPAHLAGPAQWWAGSWSECWRTKVPDHLHFSAQYCTVKFSPLALLGGKKGPSVNSTAHTTPSTDNAMNHPTPRPTHQLSSGITENPTPEELGLFVLLQTGIRIGACVPDACSERDLDAALFRALPVPGALTAQCKAENGPKVESTDGRAIVGLLLLSIFAALVLAGTCVETLLHWRSAKSDEEESAYTSLVDEDGKAKPASLAVQLLSAFSLRTNAARLFSVERKAGEISCVHGLRFLSMAWVIAGHTVAFLTGASDNLVDLGRGISTLAGQTIGNATVSVDSFFAMSGFLLAYLFLKEAERRPEQLSKRSFWAAYYVHRYVRLTPVYLLTLALSVTLGRFLGSGPQWPDATGFEDHFCEKTWWANALYLNNLLWPDIINITDGGHTVGTCFGHSWYLANDMQFHVLAPLVLVVMAKWGLLGVAQSGAVILICVSLRAWWSVKYDFGISMVGGINPQILSPKGKAEGQEMYFLPWFRVGSYAVGLVGGYVFHRLRGRLRLHRAALLLSWAVALGAMAGVLWGLTGYVGGTQPLSTATAAAYNALSRVVWSAGVVWVLVACAGGAGGVVNSILSWKVWVPLSRLSYAAYLIHPLVIYTYYGSLKEPFYYDSLYSILYLFLGHIFVAYSVAFAISMAFEAPVMTIEKALRAHFSRPRLDENKAPDAFENPGHDD